MDEWDGEPVLVSEESTYLNLFVDADTFHSVFSDLFAYRAKEPTREIIGGAWRARADTIETKGNPGTAGGETECKAWFSEFMRRADKDGPGKRAVWIEAHARFGDRLSYKGFLRVWDALGVRWGALR